MDKLILPMMLKQKLGIVIAQIVSVDKLRKKLSLTYNLNTSNWRVHAKVIVIIL